LNDIGFFEKPYMILLTWLTHNTVYEGKQTKADLCRIFFHS